MMDQIEDIFKSIVEAVGQSVTITKTKTDGTTEELTPVDVNYIFDSAKYVKDMLDVRSKMSRTLAPLRSVSTIRLPMMSSCTL
jgi:hypothetical protein